MVVLSFFLKEIIVTDQKKKYKKGAAPAETDSRFEEYDANIGKITIGK